MSKRPRILRPDVALWLAEFTNDVFWDDNEERMPAADAGLGIFPLCADELIAVDARKFARFTCWTDADRVENLSKVDDIGRYVE